jgi:hypothetical protein
MKKNQSIGILSLLLIVGILVTSALAHSSVITESGVISPGPAPNSGDGIPDGNQFIQPDSPGLGPAPNCGDGISDGSGF